MGRTFRKEDRERHRKNSQLQKSLRKLRQNKRHSYEDDDSNGGFKKSNKDYKKGHEDFHGQLCNG